LGEESRSVLARCITVSDAIGDSLPRVERYIRASPSTGRIGSQLHKAWLRKRRQAVCPGGRFTEGAQHAHHMRNRSPRPCRAWTRRMRGTCAAGTADADGVTGPVELRRQPGPARATPGGRAVAHPAKLDGLQERLNADSSCIEGSSAGGTPAWGWVRSATSSPTYTIEGWTRGKPWRRTPRATRSCDPGCSVGRRPPARAFLRVCFPPASSARGAARVEPGASIAGAALAPRLEPDRQQPEIELPGDDQARREFAPVDGRSGW
jgi:hypothetical protein